MRKLQNIRPADRKRYVLSTKQDITILKKIYSLEQKKLSATDRALIKFLRTQLKRDWRAPLLRFLNHLVRRYQ